MLIKRLSYRKQQHGTTIIEVLVTIIILAFGLLGLAGLQGQVQLALVESYQRAQAVLLLADMTERIKTNRAQTASYVFNGTLGTGDSQPADCNTVAAGTARDQCEWSNALKGAAEKKDGTNAGAMTGARGCITQVQAPNPATGVCAPGIYQVTVTWQGMTQTAAPSATCAANLYGNENQRRAISARVSVGLSNCH